MFRESALKGMWRFMFLWDYFVEVCYIERHYSFLRLTQGDYMVNCCRLVYFFFYMDRVLKFVSFNVNGLNGPIKRIRVLTYLKKVKTDMAFIQETHLTMQEHKKLRREWIGQVFSSSFNSKARRVALLININLPITF